jgi:methylmalonyl-CoA mutase N-terminal domain/subunit
MSSLHAFWAIGMNHFMEIAKMRAENDLGQISETA